MPACDFPEGSLPGCSSFEKLRSVREMEYELDFVTNRANRDTQVYSYVQCLLCLSHLQLQGVVATRNHMILQLQGVVAKHVR